MGTIFSSKPNKEFMRLQIKRIRHIIVGSICYVGNGMDDKNCYNEEDELLNFAKSNLNEFNQFPKQYFTLIGILALVNIGAEVTDNVALALKQCVDILEAEVEA